MKEIPLTQGKVALIDDEMWDRCSYFNWHAYKSGKNWYAVTNIKISKGRKGIRKTITMHQLIFGFSCRFIDHINGNGLDNRIQNIRGCTHQQNHMNQRKRENTTSRYKGVSWAKKISKWVVQIQVNGKRTNVGWFDDEVLAAIAYNEAAKKNYGEFARLNTIPSFQSLFCQTS